MNFGLLFAAVQNSLDGHTWLNFATRMKGRALKKAYRKERSFSMWDGDCKGQNPGTIKKHPKQTLVGGHRAEPFTAVSWML